MTAMESYETPASFYGAGNETGMVDNGSLQNTFETKTVAFGSTSSTRHPASFQAQVVICVLIGILGVWSTAGNLLTVLAISMHRNLHIKCSFFIYSLAISDLASGLVASPLWLYRRTWGYDEWLWGDVLCKIFWFVDESTSYCTAMHIASFAVWRYMGVKWPQSHEKVSKKAVKRWLIILWILAIVFGGIIFCTYYAVEERSHETYDGDYARWPSCSIKTSDDGVKKHLLYYTISSSLFMLVPMSTLFLSSILIVRELLCYSKVKSSVRKMKEKKAIGQLALIASSFLIGYIPMTTYVMWTTRTPNIDYRLDYWVHTGAYFALRISESLNPIIYNVTSSNIRKASLKVVHYASNCCRTDAEIDFLYRSPAPHQRRLKKILYSRCEYEKSCGNDKKAPALPQKKFHSSSFAVQRPITAI